MISDEELAELPDDPELAFVALEQILRLRVQVHEAAAHENNEDPDTYRLEYMTKILAAARIYQIDALNGFKLPRVGQHNIAELYRQCIADIDFVTMQIRIRSARTGKNETVGLDAAAKRRIHKLIQKIRGEIESLDLDTDKKEDLLDKLNKFAAEVDKQRTSLKAAMDAFQTICTGIGEGFKELEPVRVMFESIAGMLRAAKEVENSFMPRLTASEKPKLLTPPTTPPSDDEHFDKVVPF